MAVPTITSVSPSDGHSGGALVRIVGTNFRVEPTPAAGLIPCGDPVESVVVTFTGGPALQSEEALEVAVWDTTQLYCRTPKLDPFEATMQFAAATSDVVTVAPNALSDGALVQLSTTGALPGGLAAATPYYVINWNAGAGTCKLSLVDGGSPVNITSTGTGTHTITTDGAYAVTVENYDDAGDFIAGETVTKVNAFRPLRPNLSTEGHLAAVFRAFRRELVRQVVANVSYAVDSDYDDDTGDVELTFLAKLPHVMVIDVSTPDSDRSVDKAYEEDNVDDPETGGTFVVYRRPQLVDVKGTLVGVSDNQVEVINLAHALRQFFVKNRLLTVSRHPSDSSLGTIDYTMKAAGGPAFALRGNNLQAFSMPFAVIGVRLEEIPGLPARMTTGISVDDRPTEAVVHRGRTITDDTTTDDVEGLDIDLIATT